MKIWYSPYELKPRHYLNRLDSQSGPQGFLIKVQTAQFEAGYADVHPWLMFGDLDMASQIHQLRHRRFNNLTERSLFFAQQDGMAREQKQSLFFTHSPLRSHYIMTNLIEELQTEKLNLLLALGFKTIKLKLGRNLEQELKICNELPNDMIEKFRWRLDFNGQGGLSFLSSLKKDFVSCLDIVEDPEPYDVTVWADLEKTKSVKVAYDQPPGGKEDVVYPGCRVIKPARQSLTPRPQDIVTNSMDHPVGQSFAYWQALQSVLVWGEQPTDYGLKVDHLFQSTPYFSRVESASPFFKWSLGYGIGFDDLLQEEEWILL